MTPPAFCLSHRQNVTGLRSRSGFLVPHCITLHALGIPGLRQLYHNACRSSRHKHSSSLLPSTFTTPTQQKMGWLVYLAAIPTAIIMFLRALSLVLPSGPAQLVSFIAFALTAFILMTISASYGVVASIVLRLVGYGGLSQWTVARTFKWSMWLVTGVTFRVTGSMKREGGMTGEDALKMRPVVFVGNHQTEMDVLMLGCMFPKYTSVTAKSSLKWTPFLGWFSKFTKSCPEDAW